MDEAPGSVSDDPTTSPLSTTQGADGSDLPPFLTAKEAAGRLRVSVWAIYDAVNAGTLQAVRVGRVIRIPRHAVVVDPREAPAADG